VRGARRCTTLRKQAARAQFNVLQQKLKAAEAMAKAAAKRAKQEAQFRVDVAQAGTRPPHPHGPRTHLLHR